MANDKLRELSLMQKKSECFFAAELVEGTETFEIDVADTETSNLLVNLPPNSIITNAYVHVETVSNAATSAVGEIGTAEDGTEILSSANLKSAGKQGTFTGQSLTGSGKSLYFTATYTGATTNAGKYIVVVEYLEYRKNTGEYTKV